MYCQHQRRHRVLTEDYEIVCEVCGVVLGMDNIQEYASESTIGLFNEVEQGTKPVKLECAKRTHETRSDISFFSNTCDKLRIPRYCYLEAWKNYTKLRQMTSFSKAEIASFALYVSCKRYSIPTDEAEIQEAIRMTFRVKRVPSMLKVFSRIKPVAEDLGVYDNSYHANPEMYYLNLYLTKEEQKYGDKIDFDLVRRKAISVFVALPGTKETRAKKAVQISIGKLEKMCSESYH